MKKGFTLIELLVVIAIIGLLSSVVLSSLNSARAKGADAAIRANLANTRAQAELYYDTYNSYGTSAIAGTCPNSGAVTTSLFRDPVILNAISSANSASGGTVTCRSSTGATGAWAMSSPLRGSGHWCVDSTGASEAAASAVAGTAC